MGHRPALGHIALCITYDDSLLHCKLQVLADLQDRLQPFPTDIAMAVIEEELKASIGDVFSQLSAEPVAAASLGQVSQPQCQHALHKCIEVLN